MAKKKNIAKRNKEFLSDPFKHLKGFAVSSQGSEEEPVRMVEPEPEAPKSFSVEMDMLGVEKLDRDEELEEQPRDIFADADPVMIETADPSDEELFLSALGEISVRFHDHFPVESTQQQAEPRRIKQLKQGKLLPDVSLDLHGCKRIDVAAKISHFLHNSHHHGYQTVIIITGKGLHSEGGEAVLRDEAERFLTSQSSELVTEWGRAPKQYGGSGALAVFLRYQ